MKPTKIIIHHSLTKDSQTVSWGAIRWWHTIKLGYDNIGYHCGVELVGSGSHVYYEILLGRMWDEVGAHTRGQNTSSLGICFVGNYDEVEPSDDMLIAGARVIKMWMKLFDIPLEEIYAHHHFADYKSCPGRMFSLQRLKDLIGK